MKKEGGSFQSVLSTLKLILQTSIVSPVSLVFFFPTHFIVSPKALLALISLYASMENRGQAGRKILPRCCSFFICTKVFFLMTFPTCSKKKKNILLSLWERNPRIVWIPQTGNHDHQVRQLDDQKGGTDVGVCCWGGVHLTQQPPVKESVGEAWPSGTGPYCKQHQDQTAHYPPGAANQLFPSKQAHNHEWMSTWRSGKLPKLRILAWPPPSSLQTQDRSY